MRLGIIFIALAELLVELLGKGGVCYFFSHQKLAFSLI
jgi:hypothetical protein